MWSMVAFHSVCSCPSMSVCAHRYVAASRRIPVLRASQVQPISTASTLRPTDRRNATSGLKFFAVQNVVICSYEKNSFPANPRSTWKTFSFNVEATNTYDFRFPSVIKEDLHHHHHHCEWNGSFRPCLFSRGFLRKR